MIKKLMGVLLAIAVLFGVGYGAMVWNNSRAQAMPSRDDIAASREKSIVWMMNNRQKILSNRNPALWWMIGQGANVSGDSRLQALYAEFRQDFETNYSQSVWRSFFSPETVWGVNIPLSVYGELPPYQQYFLFSLTCSKDIAEDPVIIAQHETSFCPTSQPISPACVTHQLMGFRLQQRVGCDRVPGLEEKIAALQNTVEKQLTWDPRVVDVYLQRVLMLLDSGVPERVKPRWVQRILQAQLPDGGWAQLQPLVPIGGGRYFGFDIRLVGVGPVRSDFHATAQGVWLTSLLLRESGAIAQAAAGDVAK